MKKQISIFVLFLSVALIFSCGKDKTQPTPTVAFTYSVNNVQNQTLLTTGSVTMKVTTALLSGTQEPVNLSIKGLPANVTVTPSSTSGTPAFSTDFVFTSNNATVGTYPVTVEATSTSTEKKTYNFSLIIQQQPDCAGDLVGTYTGPESCSFGSDNYSIAVTSTTTSNRVSISNIYNAGFTVYADINCAGKTITIPSQTVTSNTGTAVISGFGTFTSTGIKITYHIINASGGSTNDCTLNFPKN